MLLFSLLYRFVCNFLRFEQNFLSKDAYNIESKKLDWSRNSSAFLSQSGKDNKGTLLLGSLGPYVMSSFVDYQPVVSLHVDQIGLI
jgi:hypothetical protein